MKPFFFFRLTLMTMTILQLSAVLRTTNLWLFLKKKTKTKTKISNLRGRTASQQKWLLRGLKQKQNLNLEEQNKIKTEKQNSLKTTTKVSVIWWSKNYLYIELFLHPRLLSPRPRFIFSNYYHLSASFRFDEKRKSKKKR